MAIGASGATPASSLRIRSVLSTTIPNRSAKAPANVDFPVPGQGDVDHAAVFRVLLGAGFAGPCLVERIDGLTGPEAVDAALVAARAALESAAAEAHG